MWTKAFAAVLLAAVAVVFVAGSRDTPVRRALVVKGSGSEAALDRPVAQVWFDAVPFEEAIAELRRLTGAKLAADWRTLEAAGVDRRAPVSVALRNAPLADVLNRVVDQARSPHTWIGFAADGDQVFISTGEATLLPSIRVRVYDVGDLVGPGVPGMAEYWAPTCVGGTAREIQIPGYTATEDVADLIRESVAPDTWRDNGGSVGVARVIAGRLVVAHTAEQHRAIQRVLAEVRRNPPPVEPLRPAPEVFAFHEGLKEWLSTDPASAEAALARRIPELRLEAVPLDEAFETLSRKWDVPVFVKWQTLREAGIDPKGRVTVELPNVTLSRALDRVMSATRIPRLESRLGYTIQDGVITLSTAADSGQEGVMRTYDIRDWPGRDAALTGGPPWRPYIRPDDPERYLEVEVLTDAITASVDPQSWRDAGGSIGSLKELDGVLFVTQTVENHERIRCLLNAMARRVHHAVRRRHSAHAFQQSGDAPRGQLTPLRTSPMWTKAFAIAALAAAVVVALAGRPTPVRRALLPAPPPAEQALVRVLPEVWLEGVPFDEAVARLKEMAGVEIVVDGRGLEKGSFVRVVSVTVRRRNGTLAEVLALVLEQAAETTGLRGIGFAPQGDLIRVAMGSPGLQAMQVRCYDVRDLVAAQGATWLRLASAEEPGTPMDDLLRLILDTVAPDTWRENGGSAVLRGYADRVVILQTWENHRRLERLLAELRNTPAPPPPPAAGPEVLAWHDGLKQWAPLDSGPAEAALEQRLPEVNIDAESLEAALEALHELTGANLLLSDAARKAALDPRDRVVLRLRDVTLAEALDAAVENCCAWRRLGYTVDRGVIVVTTKEAAAGEHFTRVYDLRDWPPLPQGARLDEPGPWPMTPEQVRLMLRSAAIDQLITTMRDDIDPLSWRDRGGRGGVRELRGCLIVTQSLANHEKVRRLMNAVGAASATTRPTTRPAVRVMPPPTFGARFPESRGTTHPGNVP